MTSRRLKLSILLAGIALNALVFLSWTQQWISIVLDDGTVLAVDGDVAAPAVSTLALSGLVLIGALAIAGRFFRIVLGALQSLLGATIALSGALAILGPVGASSAVVTSATGVTGAATVAGLVASATIAFWPWVATAAGAILVALGVATVATSARWPDSSRKYSAVRTESLDETDTIQSWDALSSGGDPTQPPPPSR